MNIDDEILRILAINCKPLKKSLLKKYFIRSSKDKKPYDPNRKKLKETVKRVKTLNEQNSRQPFTSTPRVAGKSTTSSGSENRPKEKSKPKSTPTKVSSKNSAPSSQSLPSNASTPSTSSSINSSARSKPISSRLSTPSKTPASNVPTSSKVSPSKRITPPKLKVPPNTPASSKSSVQSKKLFNQKDSPKRMFRPESNSNSQRNIKHDRPKVPPFDFKIPKKSKIETQDPVFRKPNVKTVSTSETSLNASNSKPNESSKSAQPSTDIEEDFDLLGPDEPALDFDIYATPEQEIIPDSVDDSNATNEAEAELEQELEQSVEQESDKYSESLQSEAVDQSTTMSVPSSKTSIDDIYNDSESSDDETNFKRRGSRHKDDAIQERPKVKPPDSNIKPITPPADNQVVRSRLILTNSSHSKPLNSSLVNPVKMPPVPDEPPIEEILAAFDAVENPDKAMQKFIDTQNVYPKTFFMHKRRFQSLFKQILLDLFCDVTFFFNKAHLITIINQLRRLEMHNNENWEEIICSWGKNYSSLGDNLSKKKNIKQILEFFYAHFVNSQVLINLPTAKYLFEMKEFSAT